MVQHNTSYKTFEPDSSLKKSFAIVMNHFLDSINYKQRKINEDCLNNLFPSARTLAKILPKIQDRIKEHLHLYLPQLASMGKLKLQLDHKNHGRFQGKLIIISYK